MFYLSQVKFVTIDKDSASQDYTNLNNLMIQLLGSKQNNVPHEFFALSIFDS